MIESDLITVKKILKYCNDIEELLKEYNSDYQEYRNRISFQYSCNMCIIQIGELVGRLSEDFLYTHDDIPWHSIKAMRNLHAHDYENVDLKLVWGSLMKDIPELRKKLEAML